MKAPDILIVDDNQDMRDLIQNGLERDGYATRTAASGKEMMLCLKDKLPDVILLDVVLADENGLSLMEKIRALTNAPVIVVSGRNDPIDKIVGLEMGADDYLGKPFQVKELSARIKAQLRRSGGGVVAPPVAKTAQDLKNADKIRFGSWILDRARLQVFDENGTSAGLTVKELHLLEVFILSPNRVLSREQLLEMSRSHGFNVTDRAIDTQIVRIRKKLNDSDDLIQSVRGAGYMFTIKAEIAE